MSDEYQSPVDEPPGKDGHQNQADPNQVFPVPVYEPGMNPPGTHPPIPAPTDPATTPPPGSIPGGGEPVPSAPPVIVDVPALLGDPAVGNVLTCTMGNWENTPVSYAFAWKRDDADIADVTGDSYTVAAADAGTSITCVVTAYNAVGSTEAPPSNALAVPSARSNFRHR